MKMLEVPLTPSDREASVAAPQASSLSKTLVPYCFVKPNAVNERFIARIKDFISRNSYSFGTNPKGTSRKYHQFDAANNDFGLSLLELKDELARHFKLGRYLNTPRLRDFIGYITDGGFVHQHVDEDIEGLQHVRINILLTQAGGCVPIIDGVHLDVPVGAAWLNLASRCEHGTTAVEGPGYRSAMSFGYQIHLQPGAALFEIHRNWLTAVRANRGQSL